LSHKVSSRRAQRVVDFIEEFLVVPEGKDVGKPVRLRDWQLEFIDKVYGTPTRRAILSMGRKNGKSALTAMLLLAPGLAAQTALLSFEGATRWLVLCFAWGGAALGLVLELVWIVDARGLRVA